MLNIVKTQLISSSSILISVFLSMLLISGCKDIKKDVSSLLNGEKPRRIVVLVDFSDSIPASTVNWYKKVISKTIMSSLKIDDKLIVLPVDYAAQTSGFEIAVYDLNKDKFVFPQDPPNQKKDLSERRMKIFKPFKFSGRI